MDEIMTARQCCVPAKRQVTTCEVGSALLICLQPPRALGPFHSGPIPARKADSPLILCLSEQCEKLYLDLRNRRKRIRRERNSH